MACQFVDVGEVDLPRHAYSPAPKPPEKAKTGFSHTDILEDATVNDMLGSVPGAKIIDIRGGK